MAEKQDVEIGQDSEKKTIAITIDEASATLLERSLRTLASTVATNVGSTIHAGAYIPSINLLEEIYFATRFCQKLKEQREEVNAD